MVSPLVPGSCVRVRVPASSANLGPGFDSVGMALGLWDQCTVAVAERPGLVVEVSGEGAASVPLDENHLVYRSMVRAWSELGVEPPAGLVMSCLNAVPHGRGLGSSATAIVTGIVAAQGLHDLAAGVEDLDGHLDRELTNDLASAIEGHPDNASASVYGGMTLSWADDDAPRRTHTVRLQVSPDIVPVLFVPEAQLATSTARAVLPEHVPHADAALNSARTALLVEAVSRRPDLLLPATREWLHQEQRRPALPASMEVVDALRARGHAAVISGAGPSVLVLSPRRAVDTVRALRPGQGWRVLTPGMPDTGAGLSLLSR